MCMWNLVQHSQCCILCIAFLELQTQNIADWMTSKLEMCILTVLKAETGIERFSVSGSFSP